MKKFIFYFSIILIFTAFSIFSTYPLITQMGTAVKNQGDPVLNVWILNWDIHKFLTGLGSFFDANIFYPHTNTLAYSEHLIPQALLALPVFLVTGKPIFTYNFLFLLSFILSGLGMFLLVEYLTKNKIAAFLAGFIFAFCPFRFGHLGHLQILTTQWIPFVFLFFHKFIEEHKIKDLFFFSLFFILQALSCSYYAFFLGFSIFIMFIFFLVNRKINSGKLLKLVFTGLIIGLILTPFFYPYYKLGKEAGFKRSLSEVELYSAQVQNYLGVPPGNRLLGKLTERFVDGEGELFPGIMVLFLSIAAIFKRPRSLRSGSQRQVEPSAANGKPGSILKRITSSRINKILDIFIILDGLLVIFLNKWGGFDFNPGFFKISLHSIRNPAYILTFLIVLRWLNSRDKKAFLFLDYRGNFYLLLAILSFLFSLGPSLIVWDVAQGIKLPYLFLYNHLPGFQGLRVPARWGCLVIFSLSVLAGLGTKRIFGALKKNNFVIKWGIGILLFALWFSESIYLPISYRQIPKNVPPVYNWLAKEKGDFAIIELPMPIDSSRVHYEAMYMYWSVYHWKSLVNGYSGFFPPDYWPVNKAMQKFPSFESIEILQRLKIRYVVIHFDRLDEARIKRIKNLIPEFDRFLKLKKIFANDYLIEVIG